MSIDRFLGLDLRTGDLASGSMSVADDMIIDSRGSMVRRPGMVRTATLPAGTAGLYSMDDTLRAVAPNGTSTAGLHPAIYLDYVEASSVSGRVQAARLPSGRRVIWIESVNGGAAQIHITDKNVETNRVGSKIALPWAPTGVIMPNGSRLWSLNRIQGLLQYSGVADPDVNDGDGYARTWTDLGDTNEAKNGGFAYIAQIGSAAQGISEYMGQIAVFAQAVIQIIEVGSVGAVGVSATIEGPGTRHPAVTASMSGDLVYADTGGTIRLLSQDAQTGSPAEDTIGTPVQPMTLPMLGYAMTPRAIYARQLGCYLLASGGTIACLSILPGKGPLGWSRWNLPVTVDELTECRGVVSFRSGAALYSLMSNAADDEVDTGDHRPIAPNGLINPVGKGSATWTPSIASMLLSEASQVTVVADGRESPPGTLPGRSPRPSKRTGAWPGSRHAIRVSSAAATPAWRCDGMDLE